MSISMHIQDLDKFYIRFLKILSSNEIMTDGQMNGRTDGMTDIRNGAIIKLDHRNYKGFPTMQDSNQSAQLQRLSRMLKFCVYQVFQLYFPEGKQ